MPGQPGLCDLPDSALVAIGCHLHFTQRIRLLEVCKRLREVCQGPSGLWREVVAAPRLRQETNVRKEATHVVNEFHMWLKPRLPAVHVLSFQLRAQYPGDGAPGIPSFQLPGALLRDCGASAGTPLPLTSLSCMWPGTGSLSFADAPPLPSLRKLSVSFEQGIHINPSREDFLPLPALQELAIMDGTLTIEPPSSLDIACLPSSLTALCLDAVSLRQLPGVVCHLPALRSLAVTNNRLVSTTLDHLLGLRQLQELNLSESYLRSFPHQVSALTGLRVLYLHNLFGRAAGLAPGDWDALRPLTRLAFLSISGNQLIALPPAVAGMSHLQGLHIEDNDFTGPLPIAPYLSNLRELLLDWQAALDSPATLQVATRLTRLLLTEHRACDVAADGSLTIRPPAAAEPLLAALAAMPSLKAVDDVFGQEDTVTAPVANAMLQLGRRCPHVQAQLRPDTNIGWGLAEVEAAAGQPTGAAAGTSTVL